MKQPFGMPGIGGSLGQCAICGQNFMAEILLRQSVPTFELDGVNIQLFAHKKCLTDLEKHTGEELTPDLFPEGSPLRALLLKNKPQSN